MGNLGPIWRALISYKRDAVFLADSISTEAWIPLAGVYKKSRIHIAAALFIAMKAKKKEKTVLVRGL